MHASLARRIARASSPSAAAFAVASARAAQRVTAAASAAAPASRVLRFYSIPASSVRIIFGSQTGNAQMLAEDLCDAVKRKVPRAQCVDIADLDAPSTFSSAQAQDLSIFVMSCYGKGEPTDSAKSFFAWLARQQQQARQPFRYAIFGLGNSKTYNNTYQAVGKHLERRLTELGARQVLPRGEGDDSGSLDRDFAKWRDALMGELVLASADSASEKQEVAGSSDGAAASQSPAMLLTVLPPGALQQRRHVRAAAATDRPIDSTNPGFFVVRKFTNLCPRADPSRAKYELEIELPEGVSYTTGDHLGVFAQNDPVLVQRLVARLTDVPPLDSIVVVEQQQGGGKLPFQSTRDDAVSLRQLLREHFDLNAPVLPSVLKQLAEFASDADEAELLKELGSSGSVKFVDLVKKPLLNLVDVLELFPSVRVPWQHALLELLPRVQPRYYSISSSSIVQPRVARLTIGVLQVQPAAQRLPGTHAELCQRKLFRGLCSNYLATLGDTARPDICSFVRPCPDFRLPDYHRTPLILVGGGTGCAPFRALIEQRDRKRQDGHALGKAVLFFGIKDETEYMYKEIIEESVNNGVLSEAHIAFSGVAGQHGGRLVADDFLAEGRRVAELLHQGAHLYICGAARGFGDSIFAALHRILMQHDGLSEEAAAARVQVMRVQHIIQEDLA